MNNFQSLGLSESLMRSLERMQFTAPTPIQNQAIPVALEGKDVLGSAQTGTGKTGAFGIPLINKLITNPRGSALVLTPTRELAVQVMKSLEEMLGDEGGIKTALLIGGEAIPRQFKQLSKRPRLIVGTPGRINDHLERGTLKLHDTEFLVMDETDRMLDMGFSVQIERILKYVKKEHQTLLFSATLPKNIMSLSKKYLKDPVRVSVGSSSTPLEKIKQEVVTVTESNKYDQLKDQIAKREGSIIIFVKTKRGADKMAIRLRREDYKADAIHGDLRQNKRDQVINAFRNKKFRILVATDVAARGLDIPHIEHVINYDLPQCPEDYIHRIGRTARADAEGFALCLISPIDKKKWREINKLINPGQKFEFDDNDDSDNGKKNNRSRSRNYNKGKNFGKSRNGENKRKPYGNSKPSNKFSNSKKSSRSADSVDEGGSDSRGKSKIVSSSEQRNPKSSNRSNKKGSANSNYSRSSHTKNNNGDESRNKKNDGSSDNNDGYPTGTGRKKSSKSSSKKNVVRPFKFKKHNRGKQNSDGGNFVNKTDSKVA